MQHTRRCRLIYRPLVALGVLICSQGTELVGAQTTSASPPATPSASKAYIFEIDRLCGRGTYDRIGGLVRESFAAGAAVDQAKEKDLATELIEASSECSFNLSHASEAAQLSMEGDIIVGLQARLDASTDKSDGMRVLGQLVGQVALVCRSPLITSGDNPGALSANIGGRGV